MNHILEMNKELNHFRSSYKEAEKTLARETPRLMEKIQIYKADCINWKKAVEVKEKEIKEYLEGGLR